MPAALLSAAARADLLSAVRWISKDSRSAAIALQSRVRTLLDKLGRHPDLGVAKLELAEDGYRFATLNGLSYVMIYNARRRPPVVMRILHGAQDLSVILAALPPVRD